MLLIDKITNVSLANGLVRIECVETGPSGEDAVSGTIAIPAGRIGEVINQLTGSVRKLQEQQQGGGAPQQTPPPATEQ